MSIFDHNKFIQRMELPPIPNFNGWFSDFFFTNMTETEIENIIMHHWMGRFAIMRLKSAWWEAVPQMDFVMIYCLDLMRVVHELNVSYRRSIQNEIEIIKFRAWCTDRQEIITFILEIKCFVNSPRIIILVQ